MSTFNLTVRQGKEQFSISADENGTILDALRNAGFSGIHAPCGGKGTCKQCSAMITGKLRNIDSGNTRELTDETVLTCRYAPMSDCTIVLSENHQMDVLTSGAADIAPCGTGLGIAVDIGTTTVACYLYNLETGKTLAVESGRNAQRPFGADVISRIQYSATQEGLDRISGAIRKQLSDAMDKLCRKTGTSRKEITRISIAANTVMEHIFAGLSPVSIGIAPFKTLSLFGDVRPASEIFDGLAEGCELYLCPALAGYVGGDITAGLYSSGAYLSDTTCLFLDIGTNGEMGLGDKNGYVCCATAAGPAFEGAEIECGMDGSKGAISKVFYENGQVGFSVIGDVEATGICGSGLVDALCVMLRCGAVEESGRMITPEEAPDSIRSMLRRGEDGTMRFYFTDKVYVSSGDIRQLQLAKSAIRAGIETLLTLCNKSYDDVNELLIAGGFGAYMDVKSACGIGLLPPALYNKTRHVGNSAGAGAALTLAHGDRDALAEFSAKCSYHELSSSPLFMDKYITCMVFDEAGEVFAD